MKQRGFGDLILLLVIGVGAMAVIGGAFTTGYLKGKTAQSEVDEPIIKAAEAEKALAVEANKGLQADLARIRGDVDTCNTRVAAVKADSDIAIAQMQQIISQSEERKAQYAKALARFEAAARPSQPVAPDQQCAAAKAALQDLSDEMKAIDALGLAHSTATPSTVRVTPVEPPKPRPSLLRRIFPAPAK